MAKEDTQFTEENAREMQLKSAKKKSENAKQKN